MQHMTHRERVRRAFAFEEAVFAQIHNIQPDVPTENMTESEDDDSMRP